MGSVHPAQAPGDAVQQGHAALAGGVGEAADGDHIPIADGDPGVALTD